MATFLRRDDESVLGAKPSLLDAASPLLSVDEQLALAKAPVKARASGLWPVVADSIGKVRNGPNTGLGLALGGLGYVAGTFDHVMNPKRPQPGVHWRDGALQFTNNPLMDEGALTLGQTTSYYDDPHSPQGAKDWSGNLRIEGHPVWDHEAQHIVQGEQLGGAYLPSNLPGGTLGLLFDHGWHGPHNWNERGPQADPPSPWPQRDDRR